MEMQPMKRLKTIRNGTVHYDRMQSLATYLVIFFLYIPSEKTTTANDPPDWHQFTEEIKAVSTSSDNRSRQSKKS